MIVSEKAFLKVPNLAAPKPIEHLSQEPRPLSTDGTHLPQPPSVLERYRYLNPSKIWAYWGVFAYLCLFSSSCWFLWRTQFWWYTIYILVTAAWALPHFIFVLASKNFNLQHHVEVVARNLPIARPSVDVFIPTCGEELEVIENTFYHASRLTYHPLQLYALDDGANPEVERLACKYGVQYLTRPNRGHMKKAGNLLYGYQHSQGDFILVVDADFAIASCALEHMIPWMAQDPNIGILQTPQYFDSAPSLSWPARGAAYCQEVFYRMIQPARDYLGNSAICVGTNALYRREALEQIGGFYQVPASEDVHNGVALINQGWKVKYIPILVARGLCPETLQGLFRQHYRWCSGSMRLITSQFFWGSRMPNWQKLIYTCGASYYLSTALSLLVTLLQVGVMIFWLNHDVRWYIMFLFLPKMLLMYLIMPLWNQAQWGLHSIKAAVTFSWAYLIAIWDLLRGQTEGWIASGSSQKSVRYLGFRRLLAWYGVSHVLLLLPVINLDWYHFLPILAGHSFAIFITLEILVAES